MSGKAKPAAAETEGQASPAPVAAEAPDTKPTAAAPELVKSDSVAVPEAPQTEAATPKAKKASKYKVWEHGTLEYGTKTYKPGAEVDVTDEEAKTIPCLVPV